MVDYASRIHLMGSVAVFAAHLALVSRTLWL